MIPKKIHYFWFGKGEKSVLEKECIARFKVFAPGCEIIEWNEENFDVLAHPYSAQAYKDRKWAFVSDYARLKVLYDEGGIYLDTDMYLLKDLSPLFEDSSFIGKEDNLHINAAIIGVLQRDVFIRDALKKYNNLKQRVTIPRILTEVYNSNKYNIKVFEPEYFYPFTPETIKKFDKNNPPQNAYTVHMWNYSWGSKKIKFLKKIGLHKPVVRALDILGIKRALKILFKLE